MAAYGLDTEPPAPMLLPGLAFVLVCVLVTTLVLRLIARKRFVRDHVEVGGIHRLFPAAVGCFCLAAVVALAAWGVALFGPDLLREYLGGGTFAALAADVATLAAMLSGMFMANLAGLRKL